MGGWIVIRQLGRYTMILAACSLILGMAVGCGSKDEQAKTGKASMTESSEGKAGPVATPPGAQPAATAKTGDAAAVAVSVNGVQLTKAELDQELQRQLEKYKGQIPANQMEQAKADIRKRLVDDFVRFVLLNKEMDARKVTASDKEIEKGVPAVMERIKVQLPPGVTIDELVKKKQIDMAKMRSDIGMEIKMNKLIEKELGGKVRIKDKEIVDFYEKNGDKFVKPEAVHVRHILVGKAQGDTGKILKEKKAKAEDLRKKLLAGADFADLAAKNSDCPSKQSGGDIGSITRGQTIQVFEDAAFKQEKNVIGPVVETQFGYHIIQVLDREAPKTIKLDSNVKQQIKAHLEAMKKQGALDTLVRRLKASANIEVYGT